MLNNMKKGFTLIELLVLIAILALLMSILLPSLSKAKTQAKIVVINAELRQIGICLEMYMEDNNGKSPPTRKDCNYGWEDHQLPPELVDGGYLPPPETGSFMSTGIEDRYNRGNTYRYWSVGEYYQNGMFMPFSSTPLMIPEGFPHNEGCPETDIIYNDPEKSPVTWIVYSVGPDFDVDVFTALNGPVPQRTWYDPQKKSGIITRVRLKDKAYDHIGTFE